MSMCESKLVTILDRLALELTEQEVIISGPRARGQLSDHLGVPGRSELGDELLVALAMLF